MSKIPRRSGVKPKIIQSLSACKIIQSICSIQQIICEIHLILESQNLKGLTHIWAEHTHLVIIKLTLGFPKFVSACKKLDPFYQFILSKKYFDMKSSTVLLQ